jgi:hypothetical protein
MHRGGTSATAGALAKLGLSPGSSSSLKSASPVNPAGFWEQTPLIRLNDRLLEQLGGSWDGPPDLTDGWARAESLEPLRLEARSLFRAAFDVEPWVWKDPRNCLVLEFWREALELEPVIVLVVRDPLEIAESLERRESMTLPLSLALWERHVRSALSACAGRPVLVTRYEELVANPQGWTHAAVAFLGEHDISLSDDAGDVAGFVDPALRHSTDERFATHPVVSGQQRALAEVLDGLVRPHGALAVPELGEETPHTGWLLAERRRAAGEIRAAKARAGRGRPPKPHPEPRRLATLRGVIRRGR